MTTLAQDLIEVTGGVDTHKDTHTAAALDGLGRLLAVAEFPADPAGYRQLLLWLRSFGTPVRVGVEGTGAYGAGLARYLHHQKITVLEIDRPDRKARRWQGKSDPVDAEAAAKAALTGRRTGIPKQRDGHVEAIRALRIARRSAVDQRSDALRQIKNLIITAPEELRAALRALSDAKLIATCANQATQIEHPEQPAAATRIALRSLARRHQQLSTEINELEALIHPLVAATAPNLLALHGVGPEVAGQLLVTAGENPERLKSEAAFAMLCGAAPLPASSGRTHRHRLNRGGDRAANAALHRIVICRLRWDQRTRAYVQRRTTEGLTKKEIIRCLKRYIAREIYQVLTTTTTRHP